MGRGVGRNGGREAGNLRKSREPWERRGLVAIRKKLCKNFIKQQNFSIMDILFHCLIFSRRNELFSLNVMLVL